jgi:DNA (cytosine-5)-methyltransferase 1
MQILDLFCGARGAAMGLHRAFPEAEITGVDINPMPRYPFEFVQADAMTYPLDGYDLIWASPPCQRYSRATVQRRAAGVEYPDLLADTRSRLRQSGLPYIIENVPLAPMIDAVLLCGTMFDELRILRHRLFESNQRLQAPPHRSHKGLVRGIGKDFVCVVENAWKKGIHKDYTLAVWSEAMGIDWMTRRELSEAVPPAYAEYLGRQLAPHLERGVRVA